MNFIIAGIIVFFTMFIPGILIAIALLKGTKLHLFEILVLGFIFGMIAPATLTWIESYAMNYIHALAFSSALFDANALIISLIAALYAYKTGALAEFIARIGLAPKSKQEITKSEITQIKIEQNLAREDIKYVRNKLMNYDKAKKIIQKHQSEEETLAHKQQEELSLMSSFTEQERANVAHLHKKDEQSLIARHEKEERILLDSLEKSTSPSQQTHTNASHSRKWVWYLLFLLMILTFATRMLSIGITPNFFEFDPYFDMLSTQQLLTYGYMPLLSTSAWPVLHAGSIMRIQPLIPYLEGYWYQVVGGASTASFNTSLMSYVSGVYPPITAALLVFVVFMLLYHEYDEYVGLIGAGFATAMPVLFTTFISGEQLLEPWGIFSLFFFFAAYMLAVKDPKNKRLAILAGFAFASTFLGAHYYTVDAGVLTLYLIFQGIISYLRNELNNDFFKMNAIVIIVIAIFLLFYQPYNATLSGRIPAILGIPITISGPMVGLIFVAILEYLPKILKQRKLISLPDNFTFRLGWLSVLVIVGILTIFLTPLGNTVTSYLNLSTKFTTPSTPLFMTVQEFMPTGLAYNYGSAGLGTIASSFFGLPIVVYFVLIIAYILIALSIIFRKSTTGVLYLFITLPLTIAAFAEVKYLPHFGVAYILLIGIIMGEVLLYLGGGLNYLFNGKSDYSTIQTYLKKAYVEHKDIVVAFFAIAIFFVSSIVSIIFLLIMLLFTNSINKKTYMWALTALFLIIIIAGFLAKSPIYGESDSIMQAFSAAYINSASSSQTQACNTISNQGNSVGYDLYCNVVPQYWINAMNWAKTNVGPNGPRMLSWWDYGDWINWFGQSPAVLRGDNSVDKEDFATAANYVLGKEYNYSPSSLANFMNTNQTKYVIFDEALIQKWGALDFLACININATSQSFAEAEGQQQSPPVPYALGYSQCELTHDPEMIFIPLSVLAPTISTPTISDYCSISTNSTEYAKGYLIVGSSVQNSSVCVDMNLSSQGTVQLYTNNGTKMNAFVQLESLSPSGETNIGNSLYLEYLVEYTPNAPNDTITNAPSKFYTSNFYKGFILGTLPGFTQVYPNNATGINFLNGSYPIRIYAVNNFTGQMPQTPPKPSYIHNNYTFP